MISTEVRIKELENLAVLESVTIYGKVILTGVLEQAEVKDRWWGLTQQECAVGMLRRLCKLLFGKRTLVVYSKIADAHFKVFQEKKYLLVPKKGTIQHIDDGEWQQTHSHQLKRIPKLCEFLLQMMATLEAVDCGKCYVKTKVSSCSTNSVTWRIIQSKTDGRTHWLIYYLWQSISSNYSWSHSKCAPLCHFTVKGNNVICAKPASLYLPCKNVVTTIITSLNHCNLVANLHLEHFIISCKFSPDPLLFVLLIKKVQGWAVWHGTHGFVGNQQTYCGKHVLRM